MSRVLLVTNDFPPRRGGIQSYLEELVDQLVAGRATHTLTVYAPKWKGAEEFDARPRPATRWCGTRRTLMLPEPPVATAGCGG